VVAVEPVVEEAMISQANGILTSLLVYGLREGKAAAWEAWVAVPVPAICLATLGLL